MNDIIAEQRKLEAAIRELGGTVEEEDFSRKPTHDYEGRNGSSGEPELENSDTEYN